jgi:hypothetical protein
MNGSELFDFMILLFVLIALPTFAMSVLAEWARKKDRKK